MTEYRLNTKKQTDFVLSLLRVKTNSLSHPGSFPDDSSLEEGALICLPL